MVKPPVRGRAVAGTVAGFVLRLARESVPRTQASMAEVLGVDLGTMQGWETGRRPLANVKAGALLNLRRRLGALGADPGVVGLLDAAMDADQIIGAALEPPDDIGIHPARVMGAHPGHRPHAGLGLDRSGASGAGRTNSGSPAGACGGSSAAGCIRPGSVLRPPPSDCRGRAATWWRHPAAPTGSLPRFVRPGVGSGLVDGTRPARAAGSSRTEGLVSALGGGSVDCNSAGPTGRSTAAPRLHRSIPGR